VNREVRADGFAAVPRVHVHDPADLAGALDELGLHRGCPVLALVGGAAGMTEVHLDTLRTALRDAAMPLLDRLGAAVVDGGTDSGVMRVIGRARHEGRCTFPLVGVAAEGTVRVPGGSSADPDAPELERHHTHFVLVPGDEWGDESPWLADVADALAAGAPAVTIVVNGGRITYDDAAASMSRGRPVVVLAGTGRTADAIAGALADPEADPKAVAIASSALTSVVRIDDAGGLGRALEAALLR
jgi:hypothetical protein